LTHSTFQHLLRAIPAEDGQELYQASAESEVHGLRERARRIIELVLAYDLDALLCLGLPVYQGFPHLPALAGLSQHPLQHFFQWLSHLHLSRRG
jgi:hypothetical protein